MSANSTASAYRDNEGQVRHFVVYHNSEDWGEPINLSRITTNKSVKNTLGARMWVIAGNQRPRAFYLCHTLIVERIGNDAKGGYKNWAGSKHVQSFDPPIRIDGFKWFPEFKRTFGSFAFGLQPMSDEKFISSLEQLRKNPRSGFEHFKPTADQAELEEQTRQLLAAPLTQKPTGQKSPGKIEVTVELFKRDSRVKAFVLRVADGKCELCGGDAPFKAIDGRPFLEVHHVKSLADGGSDRIQNAVAVCPNCHRSLHQANDSKRRSKELYRKISRLRRE